MLMAGCGVLEVGNNLFSYNMNTNNQIPNILCEMEMAPQTTKLPRLSYGASVCIVACGCNLLCGKPRAMCLRVIAVI